jgi:inner membrane protein
VSKSIRDNLDLRWLIVGSLLPDIVDKPWRLVFPDGPLGNGRTIGHSLVFVISLLLAGLLARRKTRAVLVTLSVASIDHLALDRMWTMPHTLFWPVFGWSFPPPYGGPLIPQVIHALKTNASAYVPEVVGTLATILFSVYLVYTGKVRRFLSKGRF